MSSDSNAFVTHAWTLLPAHPIFLLEWSNRSTIGILFAIVFIYVFILFCCAIMGPSILRQYIYTPSYYHHVYNREDSERIDLKQMLAQEPDIDMAYMEWSMLKSGESAWWIQVGLVRPLMSLLILLIFQINSTHIQISLVLFVTCYAFEVFHLFIGASRQFPTISPGLRQFALCHHGAALIIFITAYTSQATATNTSLYPSQVSKEAISSLILRLGLSVTIWEFQGGFYTLIHHIYVAYLDYQRCTQPLLYSRIQFYSCRRMAAILQRSANLITSWTILFTGLLMPDVTVGFLCTWLIASLLMNTIDTGFTIRSVHRMTYKIYSIQQEQQDQECGQQVQILINGNKKQHKRMSHVKNKSTMDMDMSRSASCSSADESPGSSQARVRSNSLGPVGRILNLLVATPAVNGTTKSRYTLANLKPPLSPHHTNNATDTDSASEGGSTARSNGSNGSNNQTPRWIENPLFEAPPSPVTTPNSDQDSVTSRKPMEEQQPFTSRKTHLSSWVDALTPRARSREKSSLPQSAEKDVEMSRIDNNNHNHDTMTTTTTNMKNTILNPTTTNININHTSNSAITSPVTSRRTVPVLAPPPAYSTPSKVRRIHDTTNVTTTSSIPFTFASTSTPTSTSPSTSATPPLPPRNVERDTYTSSRTHHHSPLTDRHTRSPAPLASPPSKLRKSRRATDTHFAKTSTSFDVAKQLQPLPARQRHVMTDDADDVDMDMNGDNPISITQPLTSRKRHSHNKNHRNSQSHRNSHSENNQVTTPLTHKRTIGMIPPLSFSSPKIYTSRRIMGIEFPVAPASTVAERQPLTSRVTTSDGEGDGEGDVHMDVESDSEGEDQFHVHDDHEIEGQMHHGDESNMAN